MSTDNDADEQREANSGVNIDDIEATHHVTRKWRLGVDADAGGSGALEAWTVDGPAPKAGALVFVNGRRVSMGPIHESGRVYLPPSALPDDPGDVEDAHVAIVYGERGRATLPATTHVRKLIEARNDAYNRLRRLLFGSDGDES
jgi:hypothetical protein